VDSEGRGFVVEGWFPNPGKKKLARQGFQPAPFLRRHYIITAAHCLPKLPPRHRAAYTKEKTFKKLLGPLGSVPSIRAECVFVDPVSDLAVLGRPDSQAFGEKVILAWDDFIEDIEPLEVDTDQPTRGWMLSLDGEWRPCTIQITRFGSLMVKDVVGQIAGGMSGSPILSDNGRVVGVVSITSNWPQAHLATALPQWLALQLTTAPDANT
jgi:hypothetical protein